MPQTGCLAILGKSLFFFNSRFYILLNFSTGFTMPRVPFPSFKNKSQPKLGSERDSSWLHLVLLWIWKMYNTFAKIQRLWMLVLILGQVFSSRGWTCRRGAQIISVSQHIYIYISLWTLFIVGLSCDRMCTSESCQHTSLFQMFCQWHLKCLVWRLNICAPHILTVNSSSASCLFT